MKSVSKILNTLIVFEFHGGGGCMITYLNIVKIIMFIVMLIVAHATTCPILM